MRRITFWILSTVTVLVLLFSYHTSTSSRTAATSTVQASAAGSGSGSSGNSSAPGSVTTTVDGAVVQTRWGAVQVQITVAGGRITAVTTLRVPDGNGRDAEINARAVPVLNQEAVSAQSAGIDMVSGATVTSQGYVSSLQSAIDKAHL